MVYSSKELAEILKAQPSLTPRSRQVGVNTPSIEPLRQPQQIPEAERLVLAFCNCRGSRIFTIHRHYDDGSFDLNPLLPGNIAECVIKALNELMKTEIAVKVPTQHPDFQGLCRIVVNSTRIKDLTIYRLHRFVKSTELSNEQAFLLEKKKSSELSNFPTEREMKSLTLS
jgi:hypothetical protein